jgi:hypothetical protein
MSKDSRWADGTTPGNANVYTHMLSKVKVKVVEVSLQCGALGDSDEAASLKKLIE